MDADYHRHDVTDEIWKQLEPPTWPSCVWAAADTGNTVTSRSALTRKTTILRLLERILSFISFLSL